MIERQNIIRAVKENFKTIFINAVMKRTSLLHGTEDKLIKQFAQKMHP
jgi:hypothetical protein